MSKHYLADRVSMDDIQEDASGRITGSFRVARGGNVQDYLGSELGINDRAIVRLYRPEEVVFARDSLEGFPHKLVTLGHPPGAADFEQHGVGWIGDEALRDGEYVRIPMTIAHKRAVKQVKDGVRELSVGCVADVEFVAGTSPSGEQYDAKITKIDVDHVAIVDRARGGSNLRIGDWRTVDAQSLNAHSTGGQMAGTKTVMHDGVSIETTEQGAQVIEVLKKQLGDSATATAALRDAHARELGAKDTEIAKLQGEKDNLASKVLTDAQIDARVASRADLISKAKAIHDADYSGKSEAEIRRAVVAAKIGDAAIKDKADAYVEARFDGLSEGAGLAAGADPFRRVVSDGAAAHTASDNGQSGYEKRLTDGWKTQQGITK